MFCCPPLNWSPCEPYDTRTDMALTAISTTSVVVGTGDVENTRGVSFDTILRGNAC